jgi:hypothetical protein
MLGEKVGEFTGKETGRRVIQGANGPTMEICVQTNGTLYGVQTHETGTYTAVLENGHLRGQGIGINMTNDGESLTWDVTGVGNFTKDGGVQWRGSVYYRTTSTKLNRVNGQCYIYEYAVDATGNCSGKIFEWK